MASIPIDSEDYLIVNYLQEEGDYSRILYINKMKERLESEIELLKAKNARLMEALKFYADKNNWIMRDDVQDVCILDWEIEKKHSIPVSGRRAREALKGGE